MLGASAAARTASAVVERVRVLATRIWRGEVPRDRHRISGLASETSVRARLSSLALEAQRSLPPGDPRRRALELNWDESSPLVLLEATEALLRAEGSPSEALDELLVVQCLAGRLGRWAVRNAEIQDARIARALYRDVELRAPTEHAATMERAAAALAHGAYREAIHRYLESDRLKRQPAGLLRVAIALCRLGDHVGALWSIRAALLEPAASFESQEAYRATTTLEERLRSVVEARRDAPLNPDEAKLLRGQSVRDWVPLTRSRVVDRRPLEPQPLELPALPVVPRAEHRSLALPVGPIRELLAVDELIITEIIPPLMRGEFDASIFEEPLRLVSTSYELDAPFEDPGPMIWPIELESAAPFRAEVRALGPEEANAPLAPEMQPLLSRFSGTGAVALPPPPAPPPIKTYEKTERVRVRGFEAILLDPAGD